MLIGLWQTPTVGTRKGGSGLSQRDGPLPHGQVAPHLAA